MRVIFSRNQNLSNSSISLNRVGFKSLTPDEQELKTAFEKNRAALDAACAKTPTARHVKIQLGPNIVIQRLLGRDSAVKQLESGLGLVYNGKIFSRVSCQKAFEYVSDLLCGKI